MKPIEQPVRCFPEYSGKPGGSHESVPPGLQPEESTLSLVDSGSLRRDPSVTTLTCPVWCDPELYTAHDGVGYHHSRARVVPAAGSEACTASVALVMSTPGGLVLLELGVRHDPDMSAALDMPTEPDFHLYTPSQMRSLYTEIGELLSVV